MAADSPDPRSKSAVVDDPLLTARVLVARAESLQPLQAEAQSRGMLTARYRLRSGPVFGNLLAAFARDMQEIRRGKADAVRGDLLPQPVRSEWSRQLESGAWDAFDELTHLPQGGSGVIGPRWLLALWKALSLDGRRLLLLCEIEDDAGTADEWASALRTLLDQGALGRDVVLAFSAAPDDWREAAPDERTAEIDAPSGGAVQRDEIFTFVEAALSGDQPADVDQLGMAPLADALARLLLLKQTRPLTVGIQAPWGSGKSSFVAFVREALIRRASAGAESSTLDELAALDRELSDAAAQVGLASDDGATTAGAEAGFAATVARIATDRRKLLARLERDARREVICVAFNAWRFEGSQQVWAGLARTLTAALEAAVPRRSRLGSRLKYAIRRRRVEFWAGFVVPVGLAALAAVAAVLLGAADAGDELSGWNGWLDTLVPVASVAFVAWRFFSVVQPVSERVAGYVSGPDHAAHMGYQNEVIDDIEFLRRQIDGKPRIVVAVDDLDRCSDESIMETLQAINLVLGASDFFVLLAIDPEMIHRAIARQRGLSDDDPLARPFAENYLRKIIQLPLHLPERSAEQRFNFVSQLFSQAAQRAYRSSRNGAAPASAGGADAVQGDARAPFAFDPVAVVSPHVQVLREVEDTEDELAALDSFKEFLRDNPRELKRLVNVHRLVKIYLQRPDAPPTPANQRKLVIWLVFCARWPALVDDVLERAARAGGADDCIAAMAGGESELQRFADRLGDDRLTPTDLAPDGTLASAARISLLVRDRPLGGAVPQPLNAA
jgi:hypothetical protein